jgi:UDP-2-acetamido-3-amino-2,3-dideoxy-glucuronate N-acetyltransferase
MNYQAHNTAIVDDGAQIGKGTIIWHWVHVCNEAKIGMNASLGQNVYIGNKVLIGNNVKIQNNVSVYDNVVLEDDVFCGPSMVFTNVINPRSVVSRKNEFKDTIVRKGATLGANCTIICGVVIGCYAFIGAGSVVTNNIPDYALVLGVPAKQVGWMSEHGMRLKLPLKNDDNGIISAKCSKTGQEYQLCDNLVKKVGNG